MIQPAHRHSRSRNEMMEGLNISGVGSAFGIASVVFLIVLGGFLVIRTKTINTKQLQQVQLVTLSKPYQAGYKTKTNTIIIPLKNGHKSLLVTDFAFKGADTSTLLNKIMAGDTITAWLSDSAYHLLSLKDGGLQVPVTLLSKGTTPIISEKSYNKVLGANGRTGWWILVLGISMVPYFFIRIPKVPPIYVFAAVLLAMAVWYFIF